MPVADRERWGGAPVRRPDEGVWIGIGPNGAGQHDAPPSLRRSPHARRRLSHLRRRQPTKPEIRQHIGFLPEAVPLHPEPWARQHIEFAARMRGVPRRRRRANDKVAEYEWWDGVLLNEPTSASTPSSSAKEIDVSVRGPHSLAWLVAEDGLTGIGAPPADLRRLLLTTDQHERLFLATSVAVLTGGLVVGLRPRRAGR